jgi:hypothetical protein
VTLSGLQTFFWKYLALIVVVGASTSITAIFLFARVVDLDGEPVPLYARLMTLPVSALAILYVRATFGPLKRVRVAGEAIFISNYPIRFREQEIPLSAIRRVFRDRSVRLGGQYGITVELRRQNGRSRSFSFLLAWGLTYKDVEDRLGLPVLLKDPDIIQLAPLDDDRWR